MDLHEVGCGIMDWIEVAQVRDRWRGRVNAVRNSGYIKCGEFFDLLKTGCLLKKDSAPWSD